MMGTIRMCWGWVGAFVLCCLVLTGSFVEGAEVREDGDVNRIDNQMVFGGNLSDSLQASSTHHHQGDDEPHHHYTDQWVVHIVGGSDHAERIARKHGFENTGQIFEDFYHFAHPKIAKRSLEPHEEYHELLSAEPQVKWHKQQRVKRRSKRDFLPLPGNMAGGGGSSSGKSSNPWDRKRMSKRSRVMAFNDPRWPAMWYLNRGPGLDMNVNEAWSEGITGKGIVVTILDDGLEKDHPDIRRNYDPMASFDVNSVDMDPMPTYDLTDSNRHGTRCAGEVAAEANNSLCAVGVAYEASVGGVRMLDGDVTDAVEARSLSHNPQHIDIYSASWGPDDDGKTVDGPGELATRAFMEGVTKGRQGKGSIFVWASGNGGRDHDNCNCDGYTNSIWTLSISSATENGLVPWYSEACSSTLATTYSSGGTGEKQIVTIDLHHSCTSSHTGTSASAPLAAGICALALQANTNLTWRDMQHIVVRTARPQNLFASDWATNGVGRNVSHSFGYGLMDAGAMVKLAKNWKTVPEQNKCEIRAPQTEKSIPPKSKVTLDLKVTNCQGVNFLEHVQAKVTLTSQRRGDLQIYLVSPAGTRSTLLAHRRHDLNRAGFTDWPFMSVHSWGENPIGKWTLEIHNEGRFAGRTVLKRWALIAYGTEKDVNLPGSATEELNGSNNRENPSPSPPVRYPAVINLSYLNNKTSQVWTPASKVEGIGIMGKGIIDFSNTSFPVVDGGRSSAGMWGRPSSSGGSGDGRTSSGVGVLTEGQNPGGNGGGGRGQKGNNGGNRPRLNKKLLGKLKGRRPESGGGSGSGGGGASQRPYTRLVTEVPGGVDKSIDSNKTEDKLDAGTKFSNQSVISGSKYLKEKALNSSGDVKEMKNSNSTRENSGRDTEGRRKNIMESSSSSISSSASTNARSSGSGGGLNATNGGGRGEEDLAVMNVGSILKLSSGGGGLGGNGGQGSEGVDERGGETTNSTAIEVNAGSADGRPTTTAPPAKATGEGRGETDGGESHDNSQGELRTWTLVAHGIESNPNDPVEKSGGAGEGGAEGIASGANAKEGEEKEQPVDSVKSESGGESSVMKDGDLSKVVGGGGEFDGENTIVIKTLQVANPPLGVDAAVAADLSPASSSASSSFCAKMSGNGQCLDCVPSHVLFHGVCSESCPETFYKESRGAGNGERSGGEMGKGRESNISFICLPCHYSCKSCSGPNSYECLTCHSDSSLHVEMVGEKGEVAEYHCYPAIMLETLNSNALSYKVLLVSFIICVTVVSVLAIYMVCSRRGDSRSKGQPRSVFQRQSYYRISRDDDPLNHNSSALDVDMGSDDSDEDVNFVKPLTSSNYKHRKESQEVKYLTNNVANNFVAIKKPNFVMAKSDDLANIPSLHSNDSL